jgi:hypothetical protein
MSVPRLTRSARRTVAAILLLVACGSLVAGCGGSSGNGVASKSALEIVTAARAAAESASSVHVVAQLSQTRGPSGSTKLEASASASRGQFSLGLISFEVIVIGSTAYLKGSPAFVQSVAGASVPSGAWLKGSTSSGRLTGLGSLVEKRKSVRQLLTPVALIKKGATSTLNGQPVIEVKEKGRKLFNATYFIATTGKPYPVQIVKSGLENGKITFSEWNSPVSVSPPSNAVEVSQLSSKG